MNTQLNSQMQEVESLDLDQDEVTMVNLFSNDGKKFSVNVEFTKISAVLRTAFETDPEACDIPIGHADSETLELIVEYMNHHKGLTTPIKVQVLLTVDMMGTCSPWDATFICNMENYQLRNVAAAANYLDMTCLVRLTCARLGGLVRGTSEDERAVILGTSNPRPVKH